MPLDIVAKVVGQIAGRHVAEKTNGRPTHEIKDIGSKGILLKGQIVKKISN